MKKLSIAAGVSILFAVLYFWAPRPKELPPPLSRLATDVSSLATFDPYDCDRKRALEIDTPSGKKLVACYFGDSPDLMIESNGETTAIVKAEQLAALKKAHPERNYIAEHSPAAEEAKSEFEFLMEKLK